MAYNWREDMGYGPADPRINGEIRRMLNTPQVVKKESAPETPASPLEEELRKMPAEQFRGIVEIVLKPFVGVPKISNLQGRIEALANIGYNPNLKTKDPWGYFTLIYDAAFKVAKERRG